MGSDDRTRTGDGEALLVARGAITRRSLDHVFVDRHEDENIGAHGVLLAMIVAVAYYLTRKRIERHGNFGHVSTMRTEPTYQNPSLLNCLVWTGGEEIEPITRMREINPFALECNMDYFYSVMCELKNHLNDFDEHTFLFTRGVTALPQQVDGKEKLVVLVMGDEWARVPVYAQRALAVFKAPGQHIKLAMHKNWLRFNTMNLLLYLRQQSKRFPHYHRDRKRNVFAIPYGYYRLPERKQVTPINERRIDASFTGSIEPNRVLGGLVKTPKILSRERMVDTIDNWKVGKGYNIDVKLSVSFPKAKDTPQFDDYPRILMDTKICLSPRGSRSETYRLCKGMYYGCVVITEEQPDYWFAENSPALVLKDWDRLPDLLDSLLEDPKRLEELQQASLDYWASTLAPDAVARYMKECLQALDSPT